MAESMIVFENDVVSRSRAVNKPGEYAILPRENRCYSFLPNWNNTIADVLTSPDRGSKFVQMEMVIEPGGGTDSPFVDLLEQFFYVISGQIKASFGKSEFRLSENNYAWIPPNDPVSVVNDSQEQCRVVWLRKPYKKLPNIHTPKRIIGDESVLPLNAIDTHLERYLLPREDFAFDMCLKTLYFEPGSYFSFVESHVQEHGLIMLKGSGIYYINQDFNEVQAGDFIYMAPWCLQFMYATGSKQSAYLLYKDWNRDYVDGFNL